MLHRILRRGSLLFLGAFLFAALSAAPASAGTQVVSGDDEHCSGSPGSLFCDATRKTIEYVRAGSPNPALPILVLDCDSDIDWVLDAYDPDPPTVQVCPSAPEYATTVFSTASYSAILVGYGEASNNDLLPRTADFLAYFNEGGGIGTFNASSDNEDAELDFLPLDVTLTGSEPTDPYVVTADGAAAFGFDDTEINDNCCRHEEYVTPPAGSPLRIGIVDSDVTADPVLLFARVDRRAPVSASSGCVSTTQVGFTVTDEANGSGPASVRYTLDGGAEQTLATDAAGSARLTVTGGAHTIVFRGVDVAGNVEATSHTATVTCAPPPDNTRPRVTISGLPNGCVTGSFRFRITARDGGGVRRIVVRRDGTRIVNRRVTSDRTSFRVRVRAAGLRSGRHTLAITVRDAAGNSRVVRRAFRRCARPAQGVAPRFVDPTLTG